MASSEPFTESIAALSRFFVGDTTLGDTLQRVSDLACSIVPGTDMVGLTILVDGRPSTAVFTDETSPQIDAMQYETGTGPCLDAFRSMVPSHLEDTESDQKWPAFSKEAAGHGLRSVLSLPLVASHEGIGALNFYSRTPAAFGRDDEELAGLFAAQAGIVLANAQAYWDARELNEQLTEAMASRATIEQAKGIVMAGRRCGADEAFQILVRASQRENRKLREIAEQIVRAAAQRQPAPADEAPQPGPASTGSQGPTPGAW
jgi:GAF domain-containing protein